MLVLFINFSGQFKNMAEASGMITDLDEDSYYTYPSGDNKLILLTEEEREYIEENPIITAVFMEGVAPIQYVDDNGEIRGITKNVLEEISNLTGLIFRYEVVDSVDKVAKYEGSAIVPGVSSKYASSEIKLSKPFLLSSTILYVNPSVDIKDLDEKIYAGINGGKLPQGTKEEKTIYYDTREESLNAVESGKADYGYGNIYSVVYYTLRNGYENIVTIPHEEESREYCIGVKNSDDILVSILNKSISGIDDAKMRNIVLNATSQVDRKVTFSMFLDLYGNKIAIIIVLIIAILIVQLVTNIQTNKKLNLRNKQYEALSEISNEYFFEYSIREDRLKLSDKCIELLGSKKNVETAKNTLKKILRSSEREINGFDEFIEIELATDKGEKGVFKVINTKIYGRKGKSEFVIGKLVDISQVKRKIDSLATKAEKDGLTGLYNYETSKDLIMDKLANRDESKLDAFLLMDMDTFKEVNDKFGHHTGNVLLKDVAEILKKIFRSNDIIGRFGGDEFCVYMEDIPSAQLVEEKCIQLNNHLSQINSEIKVSLSIGVVMIKEIRDYDEIFQKADYALYQAKDNGKAQFVISNKD